MPPNKSPEHTIDLPSLFHAAESEKTFGNKLKSLSFEELKELKELMDAKREEKEEAMSLGFKVRILKFCFGADILSELSEVRSFRKRYKKLYKELGKVGDKIEKSKKQKLRSYMVGFLYELNSLSEDARGHNISEDHIDKYANIDEEQRTPDEDDNGKVVISCNESFESNFAFLKKHITDAMILHNEHESEGRPKRKKPPYTYDECYEQDKD